MRKLLVVLLLVVSCQAQSIRADKADFANINNVRIVDGVKYPRSMAGIASALSDLEGNPGNVILTPIDAGGEYSDDGTTTVTISHSKQRIIGPGRWGAAISVAASRSATMFKCTTSSSTILYFCDIGGFAIDATSNTGGFIAVQLINVSKVKIFDIDIVRGTGHGSTGVDIQGQDSVSLDHLNMAIDKPITVEGNPYNPPRFDFDFMDFSRVELVPADAQCGITITGPLSVTNFHISDTDVAGGNGALCWTDAGIASTGSTNVLIENSRHEQGKDATKYSWRIDRTGAGTNAYNIHFVNVGTAKEQNGFYFRNVQNVTLDHPVNSNAAGTAFSANSTVYNLIVNNPQFSGATVTNTSAANTGNGVNYVPNGQAFRTGAAGSTYYFDLGNVTFRNGDGNNGGSVTVSALDTASDCSSSSSPAACGSAASGSVVIAAFGTTVQVNTTAVTADSQIHVTFDESLGTRLSVTCNTASGSERATYFVSARSVGSSFTIKTNTAPTPNPACLSYTIVN